ncbi:MAG: ATP phosphoribosyltransferase [Rudaea sp.]
MNSSAANSAVRDRLRIAIQKSGRLGDPARALLRAAGLNWREARDRLLCVGDTLPIDLLLVRDDDIPGLIADGVCDLGIVGRNVLLEQRVQIPAAPFVELRALGFGGCRLMLAVPEGFDWQGAQSAAGRRIATSYPGLLAQWLRERDIEAGIVTLSGSVEIAPRLGQSELICDLVSSGATLAANHLKPVEILLESEAVVAGPAAGFTDLRAAVAEMLLNRIDGVLKIRDSKLLLFQASRTAVPALLAMLDDAEAPTITSVHDSDQLALQALCHSAMTWQRLEDLKRAGARGLMVLPIERMLA